MIGVKHDGYHVAYKVLVRHVGAILSLPEFRQLSVSFILLLLLFCNKETL